jgi:hypothetical protein
MHVSSERRDQRVIKVTCIGRERDGKAGIVGNIVAHLSKLREESRLPSSKPDAQAAICIKLVNPVRQASKIKTGAVLWRKAVWAGQVAGIGERDRDMPRSRCPLGRFDPDFVEKNVYPRVSIK